MTKIKKITSTSEETTDKDYVGKKFKPYKSLDGVLYKSCRYTILKEHKSSVMLKANTGGVIWVAKGFFPQIIKEELKLLKDNEEIPNWLKIQAERHGLIRK